MIQLHTKLKPMDNSGANIVKCIKTLGGFRRQYAYVGDTILISIKRLRYIRKVRVGQVLLGLITRSKKKVLNLDASSISSKKNIVIVMNQKKRLLGTRFFG
jgi:large subunit ribosomal protein L14